MRHGLRPQACRWSPGVPFCHLFSSLVFGAFFVEFLRRFGRQNGGRNAAQSMDFRRLVFYTLQISRMPLFEGLGPSKSCFSLGRRANVHFFLKIILFHSFQQQIIFVDPKLSKMIPWDPHGTPQGPFREIESQFVEIRLDF